MLMMCRVPAARLGSPPPETEAQIGQRLGSAHAHGGSFGFFVFHLKVPS